MSHYIVKLNTGEFVYGKIDYDKVNGKFLVVNDPLVWEEYHGEDGTYGSALVKYCAGSDEPSVPLASSSIVSISAMSPGFAKFYDAANEIVKLSNDDYHDKIKNMTERMQDIIDTHAANRAVQLADQAAKKLADETGDLVAYSTDTIH